MIKPGKNIEYQKNISISAQQRYLNIGSSSFASKFLKYQEFTASSLSLPLFLFYELQLLLLNNLPGLVGLGLRSFVLPRFLRDSGSGLSIGRGVTIRNPKNISLGQSVVLDDYSVLDPKGPKSEILVGNNVLLGRNSLVIAKNGKIVLGNGCNISSNCRIATESSIELGESVLIAAFSYIGPGNHQMGDSTKPIIEQGMDIRGGVVIGNNCWIGAHSTIMDGVSIGANSIIGAYSLVSQDIPANSIAFGIPAKVIRSREQPLPKG